MTIDSNTSILIHSARLGPCAQGADCPHVVHVYSLDGNLTSLHVLRTGHIARELPGTSPPVVFVGHEAELDVYEIRPDGSVIDHGAGQ